MLITDIKRVIEQVGRDKGIDTMILIQALEEALKSAARKKFGSKIDIDVNYNEEMDEIEVFQFREVVEEVTEPELQVDLEEGRRLDPDCEIGDSLGIKIDTSTFGRIAAQSAKQVIIQKMKDAEREAVYDSFINRKGEIINGIVQRFERGSVIVNLGQAEAVLPSREQLPRENYRRGDRIRAYIVDVRNDSHGPQIILSRTHPEFLISLFRTEVPEISEGLVKIMGAARDPGSRAKISVASNDSDIDPVGACVGIKGSRVQNVVQELRGEKIDIIPWHVDPAKFVCNALAPAEISRVIIDETNRSMEVIVPDIFLSVAIGKKGQNVRLASKLTRWRLDVQSESQYSADMEAGYQSLMALPGVTISLADALYEKGFYSAEEVAAGPVDDLLRIRGLAEDAAGNLMREAEAWLANSDREAEGAGEEDAREAEGVTEPTSEDSEAAGDAAQDAGTEDEAADVEKTAEAEEAEGGQDASVTEQADAPEDLDGEARHDDAAGGHSDADAYEGAQSEVKKESEPDHGDDQGDHGTERKPDGEADGRAESGEVETDDGAE